MRQGFVGGSGMASCCPAMSAIDRRRSRHDGIWVLVLNCIEPWLKIDEREEETRDGKPSKGETHHQSLLRSGVSVLDSAG